MVGFQLKLRELFTIVENFFENFIITPPGKSDFASDGSVVLIPTKNTLAVKKLRPRPQKGCYKKDVKSKGGGRGKISQTNPYVIKSVKIT